MMGLKCLWIALVIWLSISPARAGEGDAESSQSGRIPIIEAGREPDLLLLFRPLALDDEVTPGWALDSIAADWNKVTVGLLCSDGRMATFAIEHPDRLGRPDYRTASFAVLVEDADSEDAKAAVKAAVELIKANDDGKFWRKELAAPRLGNARLSLYAAKALDTSRYLAGLILKDGLLLLGLLSFLLLILALRTTPQTEPWVRGAMIGIFVLGVVLRLVISRPMALGAWPYIRINPQAQALYANGSLADLLGLLDLRVYLTEIMFRGNFVFASLAPLAIFVHCRYLLGDDRKALAASLALALLPSHIRFSMSETLFIPSLVISALAFILTHMAMRDPVRGWRIFALVALPLVISTMISLRPLNFLFLPLLGYVIIAIPKGVVTLPRRAAVGILTLGWGAWLAFQNLSGQYRENVDEALGLDLVGRFLRALVDPGVNTLINPRITPLLFTGLALWGAWVLWRSQRGWGIFLFLWILMFLGCHAYIIPQTVEMNARYHLHLVVPFCLLIGAGIPELWARRRGWAVAALVLALAAPALHLEFEQDFRFADMQEFAFVLDQRQVIPAGATILEQVKPGDVDNERFRGTGRYLESGELKDTWNVITLASDNGQGQLRPEVLELLERETGEVYFYEGVLCFALKQEGEEIDRACREVLRHGTWEVVSQAEVPLRPYDSNVLPNWDQFPGRNTLTVRVLKQNRKSQ